MDVRLKTCIKYFEAMAICLQGNFISVRILNLEIINSIDRILKVPPAITEAKLNMPVYNHLNELYLIYPHYSKKFYRKFKSLKYFEVALQTLLESFTAF